MNTGLIFINFPFFHDHSVSKKVISKSHKSCEISQILQVCLERLNSVLIAPFFGHYAEFSAGYFPPIFSYCWDFIVL